MEIKDIIRKAATVRSDTTIRSLLDIMSKEEIDVVMVVDDGRLSGVVSEKDLLRLVRAQPVAGYPAVLVHGIPKRDTRTVSDIMTHKPITASEKASVEDVIKIMVANGIRSVIIVNDRHEPLGIVRSSDAFRKYYVHRGV